MSAVHTDLTTIHNLVHSRDDARGLRLAFDVAVDQLVRPGIVAIHRENGTTEAAAVPCLLDQLDDAVVPGAERGEARQAGSRPPASLGALALAADISGELRPALARLDEPCPASTTEQVRVWAAHADHWQHQATEYLAYAVSRVEYWVREIRLLLEPPPRYTLRGRACPLCRAMWVRVWSDDHDDDVRRPALAIDPDRIEATCASCGHTWPLDVWDQLARQLSHQAHETLTNKSKETY